MSEPKPDWLPLVETLTPREYEIFLAVGEGKTNVQIAQTPGRKVSPKCIESTIFNASRKLGLDNNQFRAMAGQYAVIRKRLDLVMRMIPAHWRIQSNLTS